jgi:hypothetical protein
MDVISIGLVANVCCLSAWTSPTFRSTTLHQTSIDQETEMAGGAVIAAAAAAHARRIQTIIDAFRLEGATAPERARAAEELGLERNNELEELIEQGVLVPVPSTGTLYLSESAYIARRTSRESLSRRTLLIVIGLVVIALVAVAVIASSARN